MFGFYYALIGIVFGTLCSVKAKESDISNTEWFTLGFAFNFPAYLVLLIYAARKNSSKQSDFPLSTPAAGITYEA